MAGPLPPPDDAEGVLASLEDLRGRIEAAQAGAPAGGRGGGTRRASVLGAAALVIAVLVGVLVVRGGNGDDADVAAGDDSAVTATSTPGPTTAALATTAVPTTASAPTTTITAPPTTTAAAPPGTTQPSETDDPETPPGATPGDVVVAPGDSFWTIAERTATDRLGRLPTVAEVTTVWAPFVAANADRLVEPGNPDLIFAGQVMVLPPGAASP